MVISGDWCPSDLYSDIVQCKKLLNFVNKALYAVFFFRKFIVENLDISPSGTMVLSDNWFSSNLFLVFVWCKNLFNPAKDLYNFYTKFNC